MGVGPLLHAIHPSHACDPSSLVVSILCPSRKFSPSHRSPLESRCLGTPVRGLISPALPVAPKRSPGGGFRWTPDVRFSELRWTGRIEKRLETRRDSPRVAPEGPQHSGMTPCCLKKVSHAFTHLAATLSATHARSPRAATKKK